MATEKCRAEPLAKPQEIRELDAIFHGQCKAQTHHLANGGAGAFRLSGKWEKKALSIHSPAKADYRPTVMVVIARLLKKSPSFNRSI